MQYIENVLVYGNKSIKKEFPSEFQCYDYDNKLAVLCRDMIFNQQWGVWYYEPASKEEAELMIEKFEEKIKELKEKYL